MLSKLVVIHLGSKIVIFNEKNHLTFDEFKTRSNFFPFLRIPRKNIFVKKKIIFVKKKIMGVDYIGKLEA